MNLSHLASPEAGVVGLRFGSSGEAVVRLQRFLARFGYLTLPGSRPDHYELVRPDSIPAATLGEFDDTTQRALRAYQHMFRLPETGAMDAATAAAMAQPRCGVPDSPFGVAKGIGNPWPTKRLKYAVTNATPDLDPGTVLGAIAVALDVWAKATTLSFESVPSSTNPEMLISFQSGDHSDGNPFDGPSGILAHAFYPPPPDGSIRGDLHFDEAETWSINVPSPAGTIDLVTVAIHEFGHALGLDHSSEPGAIMFPTYAGIRRVLHPDDVRRIQALYGAPGIPVPPWLNPAIVPLIEEWLRQCDICIKKKYPRARVDRWGRMCGDTPSTHLPCDVLPPDNYGRTPHHYIWEQNWAPIYYTLRVQEYAQRRLGGESFTALAICRAGT